MARIRSDPGFRRLLLALIGIGVSLVATVLVLRGMDLQRVAEILGQASPLPLLAILGILATQALVRAVRWRLLLPPMPDGGAVPVRRVVGPMLVGYLGNALLPARLGEVIRSALIARREGLAPAETLGSAALERILDVLTLAALGAAATVAVAAPSWMTGAVLVAVGVAGGALVLVATTGLLARSARWSPPGGALIARLAGQVRLLAAGARVLDRPLAVLGAGGLAVVAWLLDATTFWLAARALGLELLPAEAMLISAVGALSTAVPTAPGYVGTFELAAVAAAGVAGITGEPALALAVLAHAITLIPLSLAGALSLWLIGGGSLRVLASSRPGMTAAP
jgi:glycosyltransferase 2 family protein